MPRIGPMELIIILFIVLVIFGVGRLPEIGGALGRGIREFRKGSTGESEETSKETPKETAEVTAASEEEKS